MPTKIEWCDETWNPITGCKTCRLGKAKAALLEAVMMLCEE